MSETSNKIEDIKAIKNGRGIQYLLNEAYKILGNPIVLFDIYYNLIAYTDGVVIDDRFWNELTVNKSFSQETMDFFQKEGFYEAVANNDVAFLHSDKLKYDRFNGTIYDKNYTRLANINVVVCKKSVEADDRELIKETCKILSKEIQKSEYYNNLDLAYQETLMSILISGKSIDKQSETLIRIADIYKTLKSYIYVAVVDVTQDNCNLRQLTYFRDLLKRMQPAYKYFIYSNYVVIIISSEDDELNVKKCMDRLNELFEQNNIYIGISSCFENLFELRKYYLEAVDILNYGMKNDGIQRMFQYCEISQDL